jgi:hypothetical protein
MRAYEPQFDRLGALAERYFGDDPNASLIKLRQSASFSRRKSPPVTACLPRRQNRRRIYCDG